MELMESSSNHNYNTYNLIKNRESAYAVSESRAMVVEAFNTGFTNLAIPNP